VVRHLKTQSTDLEKKLSHPSYTWEIMGANPIVGSGGNGLKNDFLSIFSRRRHGSDVINS